MFTTLIQRLKAWHRRNFLYIFIAEFLFVFLFLVLAKFMFFTIPSGHAGVLFLRFGGGTVTKTVYDEGFQIIAPWNTLTIYDVRIQQIEHSFQVISSDGLEVDVTVSIRYRPKVELLGILHQRVGQHYVEKIVIPEIQALARSTFGEYTPEEMYTTKRSLIQSTLEGALGQIGERYVLLDDLLIKVIKLPSGLRVAIEEKLIQQQHAQEMKFKIDRERLEADRKEIEALGVTKFQRIVGATLTDQLLQYKGIDATLKLSESPNAKVVVIGGKNGMPLILDTLATPPYRSPPAGATDPAAATSKPSSGK